MDEIDNIIKNISTRDLVEEIKQREAVTTYMVGPYSDAKIEVHGSVIVLVVYD